MSIDLKILMAILFFMVLPSQKKKDDCLIIFLKDNKELYKIGTIANQGKHFYISLKYPNPQKDEKEYSNPALQTGVTINPESTSYNLQNRIKMKNLPDSISICNCSTLENFNLGLKFTLYVEIKDGWLSYNAQDFLVEE
ncbi:MAG: hypothetical protein WBG71_15240 [Leeuwenhoekiella sp.]